MAGQESESRRTRADQSHHRHLDLEFATKDHVWLVVCGVEPSQWTVEITEKPQTIGRSRDCDIRLDHASVSRFHAEIWRAESGAVHIRDLGSCNGVFINQARVHEAVIAVGQSFRVGGVLLELLGSIPGDSGEHDTWASDRPDDAPADGDAGFSDAEQRVLRLLNLGVSEKETAHRLGLSYHTVHGCVKEIYRKMSVHSRAELMARLRDSMKIRKSP